MISTPLNSIALRIKNMLSLHGARNVLLTSVLCLPLAGLAQTPIQATDVIQLNSTSLSYKAGSSVTLLDDGSYVVAWVGYIPDTEHSKIYARRFLANGMPIGERFTINPVNGATDEVPNITTLKNGGFVVSWRSKTISHEGYTHFRLYAKRYNAQGMASSEMELLYNDTAFKTSPAVSALDNGGMVFTWHGGYENDIFFKLYDAQSRAVGQSVRVPVPSYTKVRDVKATQLNDGFVITWVSEKSRKYSILGQRYNLDGGVEGDTITVAENLPFTKHSIETLKNGDFVVSWGANDNVYATRHKSNGQRVSDPFVVNTDTVGKQSTPSITGLESGGYLISWLSETPNSTGSVYAQQFDTQDQPTDDAFVIHASLDQNTVAQRAKSLNDEQFLVTWASKSQTDNSYNIFSQHYQFAGSMTHSLRLALPQNTILQGDVITLPLQVSGTDIYGLDAVVSVSDTSKARISGGEYGEFLPSDERLSVPMGISDNQWDGALALMAPATAKSGEGEFAAVTLIAEQAGTVNLTLQAHMTDSQGNYLLQNSTDYTFIISESVTLTGNIANLGTSGDFTDVTFYINGQLVTINPDGSFSAVVGLGDVTMALSAPGYLTAEKQVNLAAGQADIDFDQINLVGGDSNGDNQIDIADLTLLLGAYRSVEGEQNGYVTAADFNRDGAINLQDLTLLGANFGKQGPQSW
ncbi:dockerin type I domain-containing protein [Pseudoalteromonas viridis]|uniref:Dockerin domain-containing protein n=1 Tax=Pseudoalteromonas viridis TaxID=339617 RepID=A0ABX7VAI8_9GAMM|nr:dockerin type I domain-containing protein [Pseudoalteromonas viridis]QTL35658.1 hypothetical protein J5X90_00945 [Pseudoalteromonas viridis]